MLEASGKHDTVRASYRWRIPTHDNIAADADLARAIPDFARTRLVAHEYPRQIEFVGEPPMTATGKIVRRVSRQRAHHKSAAEPPEADS